MKTKLTILLCVMVALMADASVTMLYDNTYVNDAWNRYHEVARAAVEAQLVESGYDVPFHTYPNVSDAFAAYDIMKRDALNGTNLFVIHNTRFIDACKNISREFPGVKFSTTPSVGTCTADGTTNRTYQGYGFLAEGTYLAGVACGLMTKKDKVGIVSLPFMRGTVSYNNAFYLGVRSVNPSAEVYAIQIDQVTGSLQERKAAELLADDYGVDCGLGGTLTDSYRRWAELDVYSVSVLGYDRFVGSDTTLFTAYYDFTSHYHDAFFGYANDSFPGGKIVWGHLGDVIKIASYSPLIPANVRRAIDAKYELVVNGTEKIFCGPRVNLPNGVCLNASQVQTMPRWLSGIINPRNVTYNDSVEYLIVGYYDPYPVVLWVLAGFCMVVCVLFAVLVVRYRNYEKIRRRAYVFLLLILLGCVLMYADVPVFFGEPTVEKCQARPWLFVVGFTLAIGAAVVKNARVWRLFSIDSTTVVAITNAELLGYVGGMVISTGVVLAIWSTVTPYVPVVGRMQENMPVYQYNIRCLSSSPVMPAVELVVCIGMLAVCCFVAYKIRTIGKKYVDFDESEAMWYMSSIAFVFAMVMLAVQFINAYEPLTELVIFTLVAFLTPTIVLCSMFGPIFFMWRSGALDDKSDGSNRTVKTTSTSTA